MSKAMSRPHLKKRTQDTPAIASPESGSHPLPESADARAEPTSVLWCRLFLHPLQEAQLTVEPLLLLGAGRLLRPLLRGQVGLKVLDHLLRRGLPRHDVAEDAA